MKEVVQGLEGYYIASYNEHDIANCLQSAISFTGKTKGRQRVLDNGLSNELVAKKILEIYKLVSHQD